jgi:hypothetical protein
MPNTFHFSNKSIILTVWMASSSIPLTHFLRLLSIWGYFFHKMVFECSARRRLSFNDTTCRCTACRFWWCSRRFYSPCQVCRTRVGFQHNAKLPTARTSSSVESYWRQCLSFSVEKKSVQCNMYVLFKMSCWLLIVLCNYMTHTLLRKNCG